MLIKLENILCGGGIERCLLVLCAIVLALIIAKAKYRGGEINYLNSNATWHTLLTIQAYSETPVREHLFLPIVSLGAPEDKNIPWGATLPDKNGNYYYTSFSPAGFFLPWLFFRIFRLPVTEHSLYLFNTFLYASSAALWILMVSMLYAQEKWKNIVCLIGLISYLCVPEVLHGMGIVYWHQSVMQVTLLMQVIFYLKARQAGTGPWNIAFYIMAFLNPYIEWTGFFANAGFAFAELVVGWKRERRTAFWRVLALTGITAGSLGCFLFHYMLRVDAKALLLTMKNRFMARNITTSVSATNLATGYFVSFLYLWPLAALLLIWALQRNRKIELREGWGIVFLVFLFPLLENFIMKEHALSYTYDRMKGAFVLSLLVCELAFQLLSSFGKRWIASVLLLLALACGVMNLRAYKGNTSYIWDASYRVDNALLASCIRDHYADSVLAMDVDVRGYVNLLFGRGIYEWYDFETVKTRSAEKQKRYAVLLETENAGWSSMYHLKDALIYDTMTDTVHILEVVDGEVKQTIQN